MLVPEQEETGSELDIEYLGPMARSQKAERLNSANRWVEGLAGVAQFQPNVLDNFDADEYARETAHFLSVPMSMIKPREKVLADRKVRAEQEKMQQMAAMAQQGGDAMKSLGEGMEAMNGESA